MNRISIAKSVEHDVEARQVIAALAIANPIINGSRVITKRIGLMLNSGADYFHRIPVVFGLIHRPLQ